MDLLSPTPAHIVFGPPDKIIGCFDQKQYNLNERRMLDNYQNLLKAKYILEQYTKGGY